MGIPFSIPGPILSIGKTVVVQIIAYSPLPKTVQMAKDTTYNKATKTKWMRLSAVD